jgi:hypothetical protein
MSEYNTLYPLCSEALNLLLPELYESWTPSMQLNKSWTSVIQIPGLAYREGDDQNTSKYLFFYNIEKIYSCIAPVLFQYRFSF